MESSDAFKTFDEFWPFYLSQHRNPVCRYFHYVGSLLGILCLIAAVIVSKKMIAVGLIGGYLMAWIGHFSFEKNRPATFRYPLWSFLADYKMLYLFLTKRLETR